MNNIWLRAIGVALLLPCATFAADLVFSGALQQVDEKSLTIRVAKGVFADAQLPPTGNLAAKEIAAHYNLADQVRINLRSNLELKKIVLFRAASADELAVIVSTLLLNAMPGNRKENLLKHPEPPARAAHEPTEARGESAGLCGG
jgi:hypothetical protein